MTNQLQTTNLTFHEDALKSNAFVVESNEARKNSLQVEAENATDRASNNTNNHNVAGNALGGNLKRSTSYQQQHAQSLQTYYTKLG